MNCTSRRPFQSSARKKPAIWTGPRAVCSNRRTLLREPMQKPWLSTVRRPRPPKHSAHGRRQPHFAGRFGPMAEPVAARDYPRRKARPLAFVPTNLASPPAASGWHQYINAAAHPTPYPPIPRRDRLENRAIALCAASHPRPWHAHRPLQSASRSTAPATNRPISTEDTERAEPLPKPVFIKGDNKAWPVIFILSAAPQQCR